MLRTLSLVLLACFATMFGAAAQAQERPNIVFILGDDITFSDLPVWGGTNVETPNLQRLADEGMTFDKA